MSLPLHHDVDNELREHYVQCMDEACAREQVYMNACVADRNDPNLPALLEDYNRAKALSADALSAWQMYRQTAPAEGTVRYAASFSTLQAEFYGFWRRLFPTVPQTLITVGRIVIATLAPLFNSP